MLNHKRKMTSSTIPEIRRADIAPRVPPMIGAVVSVDCTGAIGDATVSVDCTGAVVGGSEAKHIQKKNKTVTHIYSW